jgi:ParB family chromosome partitioning protein
MQKKPSSSPKKRRKTVLGRGLDALIPDMEATESGSYEYFQCDIKLIRPNRYQPRIRFSDDEMAELCNSIKSQGIIQPLLVRKNENGYELVAGERRLRAAKMAGLNQVPVVIKNVTDADLLEMSVIENIQREDLNPMEEADAYQHLMTEFNLTQDQVAQRVGKSRSAVANFLRLRQLPEPVQESIVDGRLSVGNARALLGLENKAQQSAIWRAVVSKGLSVRETESLIKRLKSKKEKLKNTIANSEETYFLNIADNLSRYFGTKVQIKRRGQRGKVEIEFYNNDDLNRLIDLLGKT